MRKLQNNFTTPEQSKRLLELGVPFDSADCYYRVFDDEDGVPIYGDFPQYGTSYVELDMPCWSVGRMIEICDLCNNTDFPFVYSTWGTNRTDYMIKFIERSANCGCLDFSKLED